MDGLKTAALRMGQRKADDSGRVPGRVRGTDGTGSASRRKDDLLPVIVEHVGVVRVFVVRAEGSDVVEHLGSVEFLLGGETGFRVGAGWWEVGWGGAAEAKSQAKAQHQVVASRSQHHQIHNQPASVGFSSGAFEN